NTIASSASMSLRGVLLFSRGNAWIIQPDDAVAWKAPTAFGARGSSFNRPGQGIGNRMFHVLKAGSKP
ncbi:MAG: hypothetical protein ACRYGL_11265, partial [Janthinobacterium lividum]